MRPLLWRAASSATQVEASAGFLGVATLTPTFTSLQLAEATFQGVATITETWTALQLAESTLAGVASLDPTWVALQFAESTLLGEATITGDGESEAPATPVRTISGGMLGIPRQLVWWHPDRKPKKPKDEEEPPEVPIYQFNGPVDDLVPVGKVEDWLKALVVLEGE